LTLTEVEAKTMSHNVFGVVNNVDEVAGVAMCIVLL